MIMECTTSITYEVLTNGNPTTKFHPQRRLQKGDSMSPYIFILETKVLSSLLVKVEKINIIKGIRAGSETLNISHLMYAKYLIFFKSKT